MASSSLFLVHVVGVSRREARDLDEEIDETLHCWMTSGVSILAPLSDPVRG
jgi:NifU-like protein involved in Fe-S cluster formation